MPTMAPTDSARSLSEPPSVVVALLMSMSLQQGRAQGQASPMPRCDAEQAVKRRCRACQEAFTSAGKHSSSMTIAQHSSSVPPIPERQDCQIAGRNDLGLLQAGSLPRSGQRLSSHHGVALDAGFNVEHMGTPTERAQQHCPENVLGAWDLAGQHDPSRAGFSWGTVTAQCAHACAYRRGGVRGSLAIVGGHRHTKGRGDSSQPRFQCRKQQRDQLLYAGSPALSSAQSER